MKYIILFQFLLLPFISLSQDIITQSKVIKHRIYINPTTIIRGQYTLVYVWKINDKVWLEAGAGYQYLPYSIVEWLPMAPNELLFGLVSALPDRGIGFTGPLFSFALEKEYVRITTRMREAIDQHPELQQTVDKTKPRSSHRLEFSYQFLRHRPDCYRAGEQGFSNTYSSYKHVFKLKFQFARFIGSMERHVLIQYYFGFSLHLNLGTTTKYIDSRINYPPHWQCVDDINADYVVRQLDSFNYLGGSICNLGIRIGFQ